MLNPVEVPEPLWQEMKEGIKKVREMDALE